ncbi:MAG: Gfo/Idh/MocA family oxidoreductase [Candidatus Sumerlaeota bacterium]|nr:Gfo/Idh/MocA family oxidoreductase [Candidatus Sumerlaeota bacterium]
MTYKMVLAGCGGIAGWWLKLYKNYPEIEVAGLVDIRAEAIQQKVKEFGLEKAVTGTDLCAVLDKVKPDFVMDCTVPEAHVRVTLEALKRGCHVLGEKPLADSMENARQMVAAAKEAGRIYAVSQQRRYDARIRRLRQFIESGAIGALTTVNCDFYIGAHFGGFRDVMEHVLLLDMAIHTFDAARYITGSDPVAVYCREWNPDGSWYRHGASAMAIFEMTNGVIYNYRGSWCGEGMDTKWECDWRIIGQKGMVMWDGASDYKARVVAEEKGFIYPKRDVELPPYTGPCTEDGRTQILAEFLEAIKTGKGGPETVCTDNIKSLAMVFGAIESAVEGKRVEIEDVLDSSVLD